MSMRRGIDYEFDNEGHCPALPKHQPHTWRHQATAGSVVYICSGEEAIYRTSGRTPAATS